MKKLSDTHWIYLLLAFFIVCFLVFYPKLLLLLDEYSYFNRGLALSNFSSELVIDDLSLTESIRLTGSRYLPGTPLLIALFISILGNKGVFFIGLLSFVLSVVMVIKVLEKLGLSVLGSIVLFIFPPLLMLTRTVMSGMPSLFMASLFLYLLICISKSRWQYFLLALTAGLSMLFRETNLLIFGFFLLSLLYKEKKWIGYLASGFAMGIGVRLLLSKLVYGSYTYISAADPFSLFNILPNFTLYAIVGLILIPLGILQVFLYRGDYQWELKFSIAGFFLLYLTYGYNPIEYSGLPKGLLFGGRFIVPLLPLFAIAAGYSLVKYTWLQNRFWKVALLFGGFFCVFVGQYAGYKFNETHYDISERIYDKYHSKPLVIDHSGYTSINRYINPLRGLFPLQADLNKFNDAEYVRKVMNRYPTVYIAMSMRFENEEKRERADRFNIILNQLRSRYTLNKEEELQSFDGTMVQVWRMQ